MVESLELLISCRSDVHIEPENKYLFPRGSGMRHLAGHVCMRYFASSAELEHPERIGSTNMRKYIATVVQMLNLNEGELEWLSNHLGHSLVVHREFYRQQGAAVELGKVAKMLLAVDAGKTLKPQDQEESLEDYALTGDDDDEEEEDDAEAEKESGECDNNATEEEERKPDQNNVHERKQGEVTNPRKKHTWLPEEKEAVDRQLGHYTRLLKVPGIEACRRKTKSRHYVILIGLY